MIASPNNIPHPDPWADAKSMVNIIERFIASPDSCELIVARLQVESESRSGDPLAEFLTWFED